MPAQNTSSEETTIQESQLDEKQVNVGSLLKRGLVATGKGIVKRVKKISDSTIHTSFETLKENG